MNFQVELQDRPMEAPLAGVLKQESPFIGPPFRPMFFFAAWSCLAVCAGAVTSIDLKADYSQRHVVEHAPPQRNVGDVASAIESGAEAKESRRKLIRTEKSMSITSPTTSVQEFTVEADPSTLSWNPKSISVILPCAEEREYAVKTVQSVFNNTPRDLLREIIVVDDGSNPPMAKTHITPEFQQMYNARVLRHEETVGLIGAKKTGGDNAKGDILVFFDCHVAPQPGWYKSFVKLISENYRRMVVPQITALNIDTWSQEGTGGGMSKCYLTWDCDFKWFDSDDMYIAVISGGLLGMSRQWWQETGGYDEQMLGWGGENLDQSLRTWLCGGEIVNAADSYVAHMWRVGRDFRTFARYKHVGDSGRNRARATYAWYGDFAQKLAHYPAFERPSNDKMPWYGNISNILEVKNRLKCRPFTWFLRRFRHIYEDAGLIPNEVFMLQHKGSGLCLRYDGGAGTAGGGWGAAKMTDCDESDHRQFWHAANKNKHGKCCAGLRAWNTDQCIEQFKGKNMGTGVCDVSGHNTEQAFALTSSGKLRRRDTCIVARPGGLFKMPCALSEGQWVKRAAQQPLETKLYNQARQEHPEVFLRLDRQFAAEPDNPESALCKKVAGGCFQLFRGHQAAGEGSSQSVVLAEGSEATQECLDDNLQFTKELASCNHFFFSQSTLRPANDAHVCLDRWNDENPSTWGTYGCHGGETQKFLVKSEGQLYCNPHLECFRPKSSVP